MEEYCAKLGERLKELELKFQLMEQHIKLMTSAVQSLQDKAESQDKADKP